MQSRQTFRPFTPVLVTLFAFLLGALTFLIPVVSTVSEPAEAHWRTAAATVVTVLCVSAAVSYLRSVGQFKAGLKIAYQLFALGLILFSTAFAQLPVFGLFDLWETPWVDSGGAILPFVLAMLVSYLGIRRFARLLQVRSVLTSFTLVIIVALTVSVASGIAAHYLVTYDLDGTDVYIAVVGWAEVYTLAGALLAYKISTVIGRHYKQGLRWLGLSLAGVTFAGLHEYSTTFFINNGDPYTDYGVYLVPFIIAGILLVWASHSFRSSIMALEAADESTVLLSETIDSDYIDSIVAVAGLASRPQEIDPILDVVRVVTAKDSSLTQTDKEELRRAYDQLESYLTTRDPLRNYSLGEVRKQVTPGFRSLLEVHSSEQPHSS